MSKESSVKQSEAVVDMDEATEEGKLDSNGKGISDDREQSPRRKSSIWQTAKSKIKITPKDATPVDWKLLGLVFLSLFTSSFSLTFLFPFLPEMILFFGYQETEKGYYAGLVASMVFAGRATGSFFWGWLSDRMGRKPVMLMTIFGNGFFCLLFGFTINLPMALVTRFFAGLTNGTVGIAKTILYEISDDTNQAIGMSILSMSWGAGIILRPAAGGLLASPAKRYPSVFPEDGAFGQFPYLLPSLVVLCTCIVGFVIDVIFLPETRQRRQKTLNVEVEEQNEELQKLAPNTKENQTCGEERKITMSLEDLHCHTERTVYEVKLHQSCHNLYGSHDSKMEEVRQRSISKNGELLKKEDIAEEVGEVKTSKSVLDKIKSTTLIKIFSMPECREAVFLYTIFSFSSIGYEEIFTVWASTKTYYDGLGFDTDEIGMVLGIASVPMLFLNLIIYPLLNRLLGTKRTFVICGFINGALMTVTSTLHLLESSSSTLLWVILLLVIVPQKIMTSCCFTATSLFVNNSATTNIAGSVNGIAMTATALARTLAPVVGGSVYAWSISSDRGAPFDVNIAFFMFGFILWLTSVYSIFTRESLNRKKTETPSTQK